MILKKVTAAAPKVFAGLFLAMTIAFAFDLLTSFAGFRMPGIIVAGIVGDTFINRGLQWRLIYGIWVAVAENSFVCAAPNENLLICRGNFGINL